MDSRIRGTLGGVLGWIDLQVNITPLIRPKKSQKAENARPFFMGPTKESRGVEITVAMLLQEQLRVLRWHRVIEFRDYDAGHH